MRSDIGPAPDLFDSEIACADGETNHGRFELGELRRLLNGEIRFWSLGVVAFGLILLFQ